MRTARVNRAMPVDGSGDRIVLFSWSVDPDPQQRNVARIDQHGNVVWRAELPEKAASDCFNRLTRDDGAFVARTFSGWNVWFDADGRTTRVRREAAAA